MNGEREGVGASRRVEELEGGEDEEGGGGGAAQQNRIERQDDVARLCSSRGEEDQVKLTSCCPRRPLSVPVVSGGQSGHRRQQQGSADCEIIHL